LEKKSAISTGNKPVLPVAPRPVRWLRGALAVSILLFMGAILLVFHYWGQMTTARMENKQLQARYDSLMQALQGKPADKEQSAADLPLR
jgi:hypothetical protein